MSLFGGIEKAAKGAADYVGNSVEDAVDETGDVAKQTASTAMSVMGQPLSTVQHYYRAVHDTYARYGALATLKSLAPMIAGGPATPFAQGESDTIASKLGFKNLGQGQQWNTSWKVTANGASYRDPHGNIANPGFDLANVADHFFNGHGYMPAGWTRNDKGQMVSTSVPAGQQDNPAALGVAPGGVDLPTGIANGVFDLFADPTLQAGKVTDAIKGTEVVLGARKIALAEDAVDRGRQLDKLNAAGTPWQYTPDGKSVVAGGRVVTPTRIPKQLVDFDGNDANNVRYIAQTNPRVGQMFSELAGMSTEDILNNHAMLSPLLAKQLGRANSVDDVIKVFSDAETIRNHSFQELGLPTTSLTRRLFPGLPTKTALSLRLADSNRLFRVFSHYGPTADVVDPFDEDKALPQLARALDINHSKLVRNQILARYLNADDGEKLNILAKGVRDGIRTAATGQGLTDEEVRQLPVWQKMNGWIHYVAGSASIPGQSAYGFGKDGEEVLFRHPETGEPVRAGVFAQHMGEFPLPNYNQIRKDIADARNSQSLAAASTRAKDAGIVGRSIFAATPDSMRGGVRSVLTRADDWTYNHITTRMKGLMLFGLGTAQRIVAGELTPALIAHGGRGFIGSSLEAAAAKLNPTFHGLAEEYGDKLKGVAAAGPDGEVGRIADVSGSRVTLDTPSGQRQLSFDDVDLYHEEPTDEELAQRVTKATGGMSLDPAEYGAFRTAMAKAMYGIARPFDADRDFYDQAVHFMYHHDGHVIHPDLQSNHHVLYDGDGPKSYAVKMARQADLNAAAFRGKKFSNDTWIPYRATDSAHPIVWHAAVKDAAADEGVQRAAGAFADAIHAGKSEQAATEAFTDADQDWLIHSGSEQADHFRRTSAGYALNPHEMSATRAEAFKGLVYGQNGELNDDIVAGIAKHADMPEMRDLARKDIPSRPLAVKGRELEPTGSIGNWIDRGLDTGFRTMMSPIINGLSRAPLYTMLSTRRYKLLKSFVEQGHMTEDEAHFLASTQGFNDMLPFIHQPELRSQFSDLSRNFVPFYYAMEQAYKRYGRALYRDPIAFRRGTLTYTGLVNSGAIGSDANGNKSLVLPGSNVMTDLTLGAARSLGIPVVNGIPSQMTGNTISLRSAFPEGNAPALSPIASIPLKGLQALFPPSESFINKVVGPESESETALDLLVPNATLRRVMQAYGPLDGEQAMTTATNYALQNAMLHRIDLISQANKADAAGNTKLADRLTTQADHWMPDQNASPKVRQAAIDRVRNTARTQMIAKAIIGAVSPLAPELQTGDYKLRTELQNDMNKLGYQKGLIAFQTAHPDDTPDEVFLSDSSQDASDIPATKAAYSWVSKNEKFVRDNPVLGAYLIPQNAGPFNYAAYNQQIAYGLRTRRAPGNGRALPDTMIAALYSAATAQEYYKSLDNYDTAYNAANGDTQRQGELASAWDTYKQQLSAANPIWAASKQDTTATQTARQTLNELRTGIANNTLPASPQVSVAKSLVKSWDNYVNTEAAIRSGRIPNLTTAQLKDNYYTYLQNAQDKSPASVALITGVFRRILDAEND